MKTTKLIVNLAALLGVVFTAEVRAQLPNAWQINDNSIGNRSARNATTIWPGELQLRSTITLVADEPSS